VLVIDVKVASLLLRAADGAGPFCWPSKYPRHHPGADEPPSSASARSCSTMTRMRKLQPMLEPMPEPHPHPGFDYTSIPEGHYDRVIREGSAIRRLWHLSKFERVLDYLPRHDGQALLDIGCFAGTFLSLADERRFSRQLGVDILPLQVDYANAQYGTPRRRFQCLGSITELAGLDDRFDCVTIIEVIEHLTPAEIRVLLGHAARLLVPGGNLVLTTPNYASTWPIVELLLNRFGDVNYEEQHITRFTAFNVECQLRALYPPFDAEFQVDLKTTTHFVTPFLAAVSYRLARWLSRVIQHAWWRLPFGNLILVTLTRR
jgi:2-polyprenyl-3-methyl-5-hydroxy-6-metoxy-1,4-benzoquinol methylase